MNRVQLTTHSNGPSVEFAQHSIVIKIDHKQSKVNDLLRFGGVADGSACEGFGRSRVMFSLYTGPFLYSLFLLYISVHLHVPSF